MCTRYTQRSDILRQGRAPKRKVNLPYLAEIKSVLNSSLPVYVADLWSATEMSGASLNRLRLREGYILHGLYRRTPGSSLVQAPALLPVTNSHPDHWKVPTRKYVYMRSMSRLSLYLKCWNVTWHRYRASFRCLKGRELWIFHRNTYLWSPTVLTLRQNDRVSIKSIVWDRVRDMVE